MNDVTHQSGDPHDASEPMDICSKTQTDPEEALASDEQPELPAPRLPEGTEEPAGSDESPEWQAWSAQQLLREEKYVTFDGEDENDYTAGPPLIIRADDGVGEVSALLLNLDFSLKIQLAIRAERTLVKMTERASKQDEIDCRFEERLDDLIYRDEYRLRRLERREESAEIDAAGEDTVEEIPEEWKGVEQELEKLRILMNEHQARRQERNARINDAAYNLRVLQADVNAYLAQAFVAANLLEPQSEEEPESPLEEPTVEGEYERLSREMQEDDEEEMVDSEPLRDYSPKYAGPPPLSPEEQAKKDLTNAFWSAFLKLQEAQGKFEYREREYASARHSHEQARAAEGETADTSAMDEEFDLRWIEHERFLTRNLIEAEAALKHAEAAAHEGGVKRRDMDPDDVSCFADTDVERDARRLSQKHQRYIDSVPRPWIAKWLSKVSSGAPAPAVDTPMATDDSVQWEPEEVGNSDSLSMVAEGPERSMIDEWRKRCGTK